MINPLREPDPWNVVVVASRRSPGLAEVVGAGSPRDWDERKGYGISGAFLVYTGDGLAQFSVKVYLWEDEHFEEWESFKLVVDKPPRGVRPKALDIYHPALDDLGIRSVVVEDRSQLQPHDDTGMWFSEIKFKQFRAPVPMLSKPEGSTATLSEPTAEDNFDRVQQALIEQIKNPTDDFSIIDALRGL